MSKRFTSSLVGAKFCVAGKIIKVVFLLHFPQWKLRVDVAAALAREPQVFVTITSMGNLWLVNRSANQVELSHGELFGFNTGSFAEIPSGWKN